MNNLSAGSGQLSYTHGQQVILLSQDAVLAGSDAAPKQCGVKDSVDILESKFVVIDGNTYLVLATAVGVQFWDAAGNNIVFNYQFGDDNQVDNKVRTSFAKGITSVIAADDTELICVGSSSGNIFVFEGSAFKFKCVHIIKGEHKEPISALASEYGDMMSSGQTQQRHLISADDAGQVVVWSALSSTTFTKTNTIARAGFPCCGVKVRGDRLIVAYTDGLLAFYNLDTCTKWMELTAHSRFLSAIAIHPSKDIFATVAEDSTLNVWTLPDCGNKLEVLMSVSWTDSMLCGVTFCGPDNNAVAACAFDTEEIRIWQ